MPVYEEQVMAKTGIVLNDGGSVGFGTGTLCDLFAERNHPKGSIIIILVDIEPSTCFGCMD